MLHLIRSISFNATGLCLVIKDRCYAIPIWRPRWRLVFSNPICANLLTTFYHGPSAQYKAIFKSRSMREDFPAPVHHWIVQSNSGRSRDWTKLSRKLTKLRNGIEAIREVRRKVRLEEDLKKGTRERRKYKSRWRRWNHRTNTSIAQ